MSYTTVLSLEPGKVSGGIEDLRNSHGTQPYVWDTMCDKYLNGDHWMEVSDKLWPLVADKTIPQVHRTLLLITCDRARIEKRNYSRAAKDIREFLKDFPCPKNRVCHWPRIAEILESNPKSHSIGFAGSLSDNLFDGAWSEEKDDYDAIEWGTTIEVYDEMKSLESKEELT